MVCQNDIFLTKSQSMIPVDPSPCSWALDRQAKKRILFGQLSTRSTWKVTRCTRPVCWPTHDGVSKSAGFPSALCAEFKSNRIGKHANQKCESYHIDPGTYPRSRCGKPQPLVHIIRALPEAPYKWRHAALRDVKEFLESEVRANRFIPQFEGGLDL